MTEAREAIGHAGTYRPNEGQLGGQQREAARLARRTDRHRRCRGARLFVVLGLVEELLRVSAGTERVRLDVETAT